MKICVCCGENKPLSEFHLTESGKLGFNNRCKKCRSNKAKEKYQKNIFHFMATLKKSFCKKRNIPFDLDKEYLESIWTGVCPIFGIELTTHSKKLNSQYALDKIEPSKGYVKGNVAFISARANRIKYDANVEELEAIIKYMKNHANNITDKQ